MFWANISDENPAFQGLIQLKEDCTPNERAESCKEQGNDFFALGSKKYKEAIYCYGKGLDEQFEGHLELRAALHANRAMVNLRLSEFNFLCYLV